MDTFLRYFPAAETMYRIFVATAIGLILLNWIWQLFKNFGLIAGVEAEDPFKLSIRSFLFIGLVYYCKDITDLILGVGGTPYNWILSSDLPALNFADFNSVLLTVLGVCANGSVALIALTLLLILAWNYIKLLFEAAERYILLGVLIFTGSYGICHPVLPKVPLISLKLVPDVWRPAFFTDYECGACASLLPWWAALFLTHSQFRRYP